MSFRTLRLSALMIALLVTGLVAAGCGQHAHHSRHAKVKQPATAPASRPATQAAAASATERELFDGKTLKGWKKSGFAGEGEAEVKDGQIVIPSGEALSGITFEGDDLPTMNYELTVVAKKVEGSDFFCGITFPVNKTHASMICGGWGGGLVGISSIDDNDASENGTSNFKKFEMDKWYTMRIRVTPDRLQTWIDDEQMADVDTKGKKIDIRAGIEDACPLGISTFRTTGAVKSIKIKKL
jgi:hypothetical protein